MNAVQKLCTLRGEELNPPFQRLSLLAVGGELPGNNQRWTARVERKHRALCGIRLGKGGAKIGMACDQDPLRIQNLPRLGESREFRLVEDWSALVERPDWRDRARARNSDGHDPAVQSVLCLCREKNQQKREKTKRRKETMNHCIPPVIVSIG